jgi:hypothetical protein
MLAVEWAPWGGQLGEQELMGWMPPPDGIEVCQAGDVA